MTSTTNIPLENAVDFETAVKRFEQLTRNDFHRDNSHLFFLWDACKRNEPLKGVEPLYRAGHCPGSAAARAARRPHPYASHPHLHSKSPVRRSSISTDLIRAEQTHSLWPVPDSPEMQHDPSSTPFKPHPLSLPFTSNDAPIIWTTDSAGRIVESKFPSSRLHNTLPTTIPKRFNKPFANPIKELLDSAVRSCSDYFNLELKTLKEQYVKLHADHVLLTQRYKALEEDRATVLRLTREAPYSQELPAQRQRSVSFSSSESSCGSVHSLHSRGFDDFSDLSSEEDEEDDKQYQNALYSPVTQYGNAWEQRGRSLAPARLRAIPSEAWLTHVGTAKRPERPPTPPPEPEQTVSAPVFHLHDLQEMYFGANDRWWCRSCMYVFSFPCHVTSSEHGFPRMATNTFDKVASIEVGRVTSDVMVEHCFIHHPVASAEVTHMSVEQAQEVRRKLKRRLGDYSP